MAASTITRATWTDDTGTAATPNADGTVINNTRLQNDIYAAIDAMFAGAGAYATFTFAGKIAVEGFGVHLLSAGGTGENSLRVRNTTAGTGNFAGVRLGNDTSATQFGLLGFSSTYTTAGASVQNGLQLYSGGAGGLSIDAQHASGEIRFYTGSSVLRGTVSSAGLWSFATFGTHAFSAGGTGGNVLSVRNTTAGTGNFSRLAMGNDTSALQLILDQYSSTFTTSGYQVQDGVLMAGSGAGGISIAAQHASGVIRFYTGGTTERARMLSGGQWQIVDGSAATPAIAFASDTTTGFYNTAVGDGEIAFAVAGVKAGQFDASGISMVSSDRGASAAGQSLLLGRNSNAAGAGGQLALTSKGNQLSYVWADDTASPGILRIHSASPAIAGDTAGTVVGSQSSNLASKHIHGWATHDTRRWALQQIVDTPIADFSYRSGWRGERFWGLITDHSPLFGLDRDADHPAGKMLNEVMLHGCTLLAIQQLQHELVQLQQHVTRLETA